MTIKILLVSLFFVCSTLAVSVPYIPPYIPQDSIHEFKLKWTLEALREQLNIEELTAEYNRNKDWAALKAGLEAVLSKNAGAYYQLLNIPSDAEHGLREVGLRGLTELSLIIAFLGSSPDIANADGDTILIGAAIGGKLRTAALLLELGANIEAKDKWGCTPLILAAKYDQPRIARFLISKGANVNGAEFDGKTALYWAAKNGNLPLVENLVQAGATVSAKTGDGKTPAEIAKDNKHEIIAEYLSNAEK